MSKAEPSHSPEEIKKRRKDVPYFIDPRQVTPAEEQRVKMWAKSVMSQHEKYFDPKIYKHGDVVAKNSVRPEDIDIKQIYPFPNLYWIIYRNERLNAWSIVLKSGRRILNNVDFWKI